MSIRIEVHAHLGFKPWLACITGTDAKYGLARSFVRSDEYSRSRSGRTGNQAWELDSIGLYQLGGTKRDDELFMLWVKEGKLVKTVVDTARAKAIARLLDEGKDFDAARQATKPVTTK